MFDNQKTQPAVIDTLQIEAEARRMRAEFFAAGMRSAARWVATVFTARPTTGAQH